MALKRDLLPVGRCLICLFFFLFFFFVWLSQSSFVAINVFDSCKSIFLFVVAIQSEFFFSVT